MYKSIMEIQDEFRKQDLKFKVEQIGDNWVLTLTINGKAASYEFLFIKDDDVGNDVSVRVFDIVKFPEDRWDKALEVLNHVQQEYRYVRLTLDSKGGVDAQYDFPVEYKNIGEGAFEILLRMTNILDDCYSDLMRALWG